MVMLVPKFLDQCRSGDPVIVRNIGLALHDDDAAFRKSLVLQQSPKSRGQFAELHWIAVEADDRSSSRQS